MGRQPLEDADGFVPLALPDSKIHDSIHDVPVLVGWTADLPVGRSAGVPPAGSWTSRPRVEQVFELKP